MSGERPSCSRGLIRLSLVLMSRPLFARWRFLLWHQAGRGTLWRGLSPGFWRRAFPRLMRRGRGFMYMGWRGCWPLRGTGI